MIELLAVAGLVVDIALKNCCERSCSDIPGVGYDGGQASSTTIQRWAQTTLYEKRNLIFLISEAQRDFRNEFFDSVKAQHNSHIAERHFRTKLKRILTFAIRIS